MNEITILQNAFKELPEWFETADVETITQLIDKLVMAFEFPTLRSELEDIFIKYAVYVHSHVEKVYPDLYHLIADKPRKRAEKQDISDIYAPKLADYKEGEILVARTPKTDIKRPRTNTEKIMLNDMSNKITELRKTKKKLTIGLVAMRKKDDDLSDIYDKMKDCDVIFTETRLGIDTERIVTKHALSTLEKGDLLVVNKATDLAKSTTQLFNAIISLSDREVTVMSLEDSWMCTLGDEGTHMINTIRGLAAFEQDLLVERKNDAVRKAQQEGTKFGRSLKEGANIERAIEMYKNNINDYTVTKIAELNNISRATLWRRLRDQNLLVSKKE